MKTPVSNDGGRLFLELYKFLGNDDPFREYKRRSSELARKVAKDIGTVDDFKTVMRLAIAGNVIDVSVGYNPG